MTLLIYQQVSAEHALYTCVTTQEPTHQKLAPLTCKGGNPQKPGRLPGVTPNALLDHINTIAPPKAVCHRMEPQLVPTQVLSVTDLLKCQMCEQMLVQPLTCTLHCNAVVCTKCITDYIATSASTQCPCCDESVNLLPSSVQPAPAMIQRLLHDVMVSCTTCNKHIQAGTHDCHKADVQEEICASV